MSGLGESEWLLQRLCESLVRLAKRPSVHDGEAKVDNNKVGGEDERCTGEQATVVKTDEQRQ